MLSAVVLAVLISLLLVACTPLIDLTPEPEPTAEESETVTTSQALISSKDTSDSIRTGPGPAEEIRLSPPEITDPGQGIFFEAEDETEARLLPASESWHSHEEFVNVPPASNRPGPSGGGNWYLSRNGESLVYEFDAPLAGEYSIYVRDFSSNDWPPGYRSMRINMDDIDLGIHAENDIRAAYPPGVFGWHKTTVVALEEGPYTMIVTKEGPAQAGPLLDAFYLTTNPDDDPEFTLTLETVWPTPPPVVPVPPDSEDYEQYATSATASSEFTSYYGAVQATEAPELRSNCADAVAWSPATDGIHPEWLEASFSVPVFATGITVYEPYNSGFVYQVDLIDTDGVYHTIWTGVDTTTCPGELALSFDQTIYQVVGARSTPALKGMKR
ncbi:MAG: hypothetical protein CL902_04835 [Dehalococcoidia bacterium]|nr:hypothetical protein [Dehalococcoidia bacterium]